jgi:protein-S-isoprenylcysteine O-methyltransferase Ste14
MSHRTRHLPEVRGLHRIIRELRYHEASRQVFAIVLIILFAVMGHPTVPVLYYAGLALIVAGMWIRMWASGHVKKNKVLATDGPYAYVRHPLYVGNILLLAGFVLAAQLIWAAVLVAVFLWFYYPPAIDYEDRKLHNLFGEEWERWRLNTKALIPTKPQAGSARLSGKSDWSFKQSLMQNGEPLIVLLVIICAYVLFARLY